ncbi:MAG: hypothetical protein K2L91_00595 [Duncaniella sp.]|nr:hypothetical protein [Duncaniella sp.]MDE6327005.1 hypothetical protein [Duncaniella sp.]
MGNMIYWLLASILFGVVSGALYTWMSPRRERRLPLMLRSMAIYTVLGMVVVYIISLFV